MNKEKSNKLLQVADRALQASPILDKEKGTIKESYNSSVAAFSVSIAMCGLRPTLTIYYHKEERKEILKIITDMLLDGSNTFFKFSSKERDFDNAPICVERENSAKKLLKYAFYCDNKEMKRLQREITDCGIALKQVIRTYKLVKDEKD